MRNEKNRGMKRAISLSWVLICSVIFIAVSALAQQGRPGDGSIRGGGPRMYDPSKTEKISGEVVAVKEFAPKNGKIKITGLELRTGSETIVVHLGPAFYVDAQPVKISAGDKVEITGIRTERRGRRIFLAGEVKRGGDVLRLRDEKGMPLWAGSRPEGGAVPQ